MRAALLAFALSQAACSLYVYEKGTVKRIDVQKQAAKPRLSVSAVRSKDGMVTLRLRGVSDVKLTRTVRYNTIEWKGGWNPALEIVELITSPLYILIIPWLAVAGVAPPSAPHIHVPASTRAKVAFAPINPAVSIFSVDMSRSEVSTEEVFSGEPVDLRYAVRLPARAKKLHYRALAPDGAEIAQGEAQTDRYGEVSFAAVGATTVKVNVEGLDETVPVR
jgi:hypothetical protein